MPRLHTRLVFTPTGPAHLGHAYLARINRELAIQSGGSFTYRFENVLAAVSNAKWRDDRLRQSEENLADMAALGLAPTPPALLRELGFDPGIGYSYQSGSSLALHYYRLWGLAEVFGDWPPPYPEGAVDNEEAIYLKGAGETIVHPYVILERVVADIHTGRNCVVRGEDLRRESCAYGMFAHMVLRNWQGGGRAAAPAQHFLPLLKRGNGAPEGPQLLSSSTTATTGNMFIRDVREAGRSGEELWGFLDAYTTKAPWRPEGWGGPEGVRANLLAEPVIPQGAWDAFLAGDWERAEGAAA